MKNGSGQQPLFTGKPRMDKDVKCTHIPSEDCWLGLNTNHRRLFAALQDGWMRPLPTGKGVLLGTGRYVPEQYDGGKHPISVYMKIDVRKLPRLDVPAFRDGGWTDLFTARN